MRSLRLLAGVLAIGGVAALVLFLSREPPAAPIGEVRMTEIRIEPEVSGRIAAIRVKPGDVVRAGDVLVDLENPEMAAALAEARAAAAEARAARDRVYAGPRQEQVDTLDQEVGKRQSNVTLAKQTFARASALAASQNAPRAAADKATAELSVAEAALATSRALLAESEAGPTTEERAIADANVGAADAAVSVIERRLAKTILAAPVDGIIRVIAAEPGEAVIPGRSILTVEAEAGSWFSFVVREDHLSGLRIGTTVDLVSADGRKIVARVSEIRALGEYATWRAARAVGDHDLNSFTVRADAVQAPGSPSWEPGMTVWLTVRP
jgi:HlyD family secretion protein